MLILSAGDRSTPRTADHHAGSRSQMSLSSALMLLALIGCVCAQAAVVFPVYPGAVKAMDMSGAALDHAGVMLMSPDPMPTIRDWYLEQLERAEWEVQSIPHPMDFVAKLIADKPEQQVSAVITITGRPATDPGDTMILLMVNGPGVSSDMFKAVPDVELQRETPDERRERLRKAREELMELHPEIEQLLGDRPEDGVSPTPPNSFQESMTDLHTSLSELVTAMSNWCANPGEATEVTVLNAAESHRTLSQALSDEATVWSGSPGACTASTAVFFQNVLTNIDLGVALLGIERWREVPDPAERGKLHEDIRRLVRQIRDEDAQRLVAMMRVAADVVDVAKREPGSEVYGGPDTPLSNEIIVRAGAEPFVPETELVVTRLWTPTPQYWEQVLRETWTQLRCWEANCPAGCHPIEDTNLYHCEAFGDYDVTTGDPPRTLHCLGVEHNREHEVEYLSYPMTLYGLVSLQIKVGDPAQLDGGGELRFFINGRPLMTTWLDPIDRPFYPNTNPWDLLRVHAGTDVEPDISMFEKWAEGVDYLFGEEAGQQWRNSFRAPWVTAESRGGEFNGYVLSTVIGQVFAAGGLALDISPPPLACNETPLTMMLKMRDIAQMNHPALEKPSTVRIEAVVGGVAAQAVEFDIPAVFDDLRGQAEGWDGWPGDNPETWSFGTELGTPPPKEAPPKIDINAIALDLLEDSQRMADTYQLLIMEQWRKKLTDMLIDKLFSSSSKEYKDAVDGFPEIGSKGWNYVKDAMSATYNWMSTHGAAGTIQNQILDGQIGGFLGDMAKEMLPDAISKDTMDGIKKWRGESPYLVSRDLTQDALTEDARKMITYWRWLMWVNGETALKLHDDLGKAENIASYGSIAKTAGGPVVSAYVSAALDGAQLGAYTGLLISNLYSLYEIERCLNLIHYRLKLPHSWLSN